MTVTKTTASALHETDGLVTDFPFEFAIGASSNLSVQLISSTGDITDVPDTDYDVVITGAEAGYVAMNSAPSAGQKLYVSRQTQITQLIAVTGQTKYDPVVVERVWDKLTQITQELQTLIDRAILTVPGFPPENYLDIIAELRNEAVGAAELAEAWAESPTPPNPGDPTSKSAKTWAGLAETSANTSLAAAAQAALYDGPRVNDFAALLADTSMTYSAGAGRVVPGQAVLTRAEGYSYRVAASGATDHHLTTAGGVKLYVLPLPDGTFSPRQIGTPADGVEISSDHILKIRDIAGPNRVIVGGANDIYVLDTQIDLLTGQKWRGNGARIKRAPQVTATTTTSIGTGTSPTTIGVGDASSFRVGSYVTVTQGGGENTDKYLHRIVSKTASSITVGSVFGIAFTAGATVLTTANLISLVNPDSEWSGWDMDGNRAAYQTAGLRWELMCEVRASGARSRIENNVLRNCPAEGIMLGGHGSIATRNAVLTAGGNGIHLSGGDDLLVESNWFQDCNQVPVGTIGHEDGCVSWSNVCGRAKIISNTCINGLSGFGEISLPDASHCTISGNTVIDCDSPWEGVSFGEPGSAVIIAQNRFYNCGTGTCGSTKVSSTEAETQTHWQISGNYFEETLISLNQTYMVDIIENHFRFSDATVATSFATILVAGASITRITGNLFDGYDSCIYANSAAKWVEVSGNTFRRGRRYAANLGDMTTPQATFERNKVIGDAVLASGSYYAVNLPEGGVIRDNDLNIPVGARAATVRNKQVVTGNTVRSPSGVGSFTVPSGVTGAVVVGNFVQQAVSDGTAGASTVADNYALVA